MNASYTKLIEANLFYACIFFIAILSCIPAQHLDSVILQKLPRLLMMSLCCTYLDSGLSFEVIDRDASLQVHASGEYKCGLYTSTTREVNTQ